MAWTPEDIKNWKKCAKCLNWWPLKAYRPSEYPWSDKLQKVCIHCNPSGIEQKYYYCVCSACHSNGLWSPVQKDRLCTNCWSSPAYKKKRAEAQVEGPKIRYEYYKKHIAAIPEYVKSELKSEKEWYGYHAYDKETRQDKANKNKELMQKRMARAMREARLAKAPTNYTWEGWMLRVQFYGWRCVYCNTELTLEKNLKNTLTCDHYKPLSKGGTHYLSNLFPACKSCNGKKWAHLGWKIRFRV